MTSCSFSFCNKVRLPNWPVWVQNIWRFECLKIVFLKTLLNNKACFPGTVLIKSSFFRYSVIMNRHNLILIGVLNIGSSAFKWHHVLSVSAIRVYLTWPKYIRFYNMYSPQDIVVLAIWLVSCILWLPYLESPRIRKTRKEGRNWTFLLLCSFLCLRIIGTLSCGRVNFNSNYFTQSLCTWTYRQLGAARLVVPCYLTVYRVSVLKQN